MGKNWHFRCILCAEKTDNRVCVPCYTARLQPCSVCSKPTPTITRVGTEALNTTCRSCTASKNADTRKVGKRCKVCGVRSAETAQKYQVCPPCQDIKAACPVCNSEMPKYRKRGMLRVTCSNRCRKILHPTTSEQAIRGNQTKRAAKPPRSHQNKLARVSQEYQDWRKAVFERDGYRCQDCGARNGGGKTVSLHPHHIKPFATHVELRYEVLNGVTLCQPCHRKRHKHVFIGRTKKARGQLSLPIAAK